MTDSPQLLQTVPLVLGGLALFFVLYIIGEHRDSLTRQHKFGLAYFAVVGFLLLTDAATEYFSLGNYSLLRLFGLGLFVALVCFHAVVVWKSRSAKSRRR